MKHKKAPEVKNATTQKPQEEKIADSAINIAIGIAAAGIMALIIIWMMNALL
jgi:hypothetical protein